MKTPNRWLGLLGVVVLASSVGVSGSSSSTGCQDDWIGDGNCDSRNNNALCSYDGGDCCECTCVGSELQCGEDGNYACIDPSAPCVDDDDITIDKVENCFFSQLIGNGECDMENNNVACDYDGGDCCECTCSKVSRGGDDSYGCSGGFACLDPEAQCEDEEAATVGAADDDDFSRACWSVKRMGDGYCDEDNNISGCNYDGGDCCQCTCDPANFEDDPRACRGGNWKDFACIDPMAPCVDDDSVTVDMIDICNSSSIGDGICDPENNVEECAYDGGDCCSCTCEVRGRDDDDTNPCSSFACVDPSADCANDDDITVDMLEDCQFAPHVGNGRCNHEMNTPECNYDGGDCCECTCQVGDSGDDEWNGRYDDCIDFACIDPDAPCVDDDLITIEMIEECYDVSYIGDGKCNSGNNNELCLYDGGDCCSCTCDYEFESDYACFNEDSVGFDCKDPSVPCFGEEKTLNDDDDNYYTDDDGTTTETDDSDDLSEGDDITIDGEDDDNAMSYEFVPGEPEEILPTVDGAVEVGTKTDVGVTATAYDVRPGRSSGMVGCGEEGGDGCAPANSRDGIASEIESRWSCATKIVDGGGPCQIEYTFAEPQDIVDIQVAFWKGNLRDRTLEVHVNGVLAHTHESYSGSTFNTLGVVANGITTVKLESIGLVSDDWISLIEALIFVKP